MTADRRAAMLSYEHRPGGAFPGRRPTRMEVEP